MGIIISLPALIVCAFAGVWLAMSAHKAQKLKGCDDNTAEDLKKFDVKGASITFAGLIIALVIALIML